MAGGNPNQGGHNQGGQHQGGHNPAQGGTPARPQNPAQNVQNQAQNVKRDVKDGVDQASNRLREGFDTAREEAGQRLRQAGDQIASNPVPSVLIGFGLGVGIGLALTVMLIPEREETWGEKAERYVPESFRDIPDRLRKARVGEHVRQAGERVREMNIPESVTDHFQSLASSLKDLPGLLSKYLPGR